MSKRSIPPVEIRTLSRASHSVNRKTGESYKHSNTRYGSNTYDFLAYLARETLIDYDTGKFTKDTDKGGLVESYCVPPKDCSWAADLQQYAQEVSENDKRKNSRYGREFLFVCPNGMKLQTFLALMRRFSFWMSQIYNTAPFVFVHDPKADSWDGPPETGRNLHAHVFLPTRQVHPWGMGMKLYMLDYEKLAKKEVEGIREHWARELELGFKSQNEKVEFDHRSYVRRGIERLPQPKIGAAATAMNERGLYTYRMAEKEQTDEMNEYLEAAEKVLERFNRNIESLEKLSERKLFGTSCLEVKSRWTGSEWRELYDLNINNTLEFIEELNAKTEVFDDLIDDLLLLKKRCSEEVDYNPVIEDVPKDTDLGDLLMIIGQQLSEYGMKGFGRSRSRSREVERAAHPGYSAMER